MAVAARGRQGFCVWISFMRSVFLLGSEVCLICAFGTNGRMGGVQAAAAVSHLAGCDPVSSYLLFRSCHTGKVHTGMKGCRATGQRVSSTSLLLHRWVVRSVCILLGALLWTGTPCLCRLLVWQLQLQIPCAVCRACSKLLLQLLQPEEGFFGWPTGFWHIPPSSGRQVADAR